MIDVPPAVRSMAGAVGSDAWLRALPELVAEVARDWSIVVGGAFGDATEAFVAAATQEDGTPVVLKLIVPRSGGAASNEIEVLRLAAGDGCVRLLRHDVERGALLLERLGRSLHELDLPIERRHEILCTAAEGMWRPATEADLPTGAEKGRWLAEIIPVLWEDLGRPCSERAVDHALACAEVRIAAHDDARAVLVHGDVHQWNALEASVDGSADGFRLVDPDGLRAEPEYDLGIIMREDPEQLLAGDPIARSWERAAWLAARCGLDATATWEWGVVERVSTGLFCVRDGLGLTGDQMLEVADRLAV